MRQGFDEGKERHPRPGRPRPLATLIAAAVLVALGAGAAWFLTGGRAAIVATPSMGTAAPVGTLVLTRPAADIRVGDVITYRAPNPDVHHTTTHRVVAVDTRAPGGPVYTARGDINGATDPWAIRPGDVVGRAAVLAWGLGWLVRALPALVAGVLLLWWATRWTPLFWRVPVRVLGLSLVMAAVVTWLKPFVGVIDLGITADAAGSHVDLVSTGLLPIRVTAATGGHVDLVDGQTGVLTTVLPAGAKGAVLTSGVHMPWWLWVVMTLVWLTPMAGGLVTALRHPTLDDPGAPPPAGPPADAVTEPIPLVPAARPEARWRAVGLAFTAVLALTTSATTSAFTATVTNSANTAASNPYFTCAGATTGVAGVTPFLVWPLNETAPLVTATDISGNNRTGVYTGTFTTTTTTACPRDPLRAVTTAPTALSPSYVATTLASPVASVNAFTMAIWFRTTTTTGGRLIGWGNARIGSSTVYDRHLYMTDDGRVVLGVFPSSMVKVVTSPRSYNDGQWHLAVGTLSSAGLVLYLDGAAVASDTATTTAEGGTGNTGFWRVGWDNLAGWPTAPTTYYWTGSLAYAAVYLTALTAAQVRVLYAAGT